jgi:hypothetical protein
LIESAFSKPIHRIGEDFKTWMITKALPRTPNIGFTSKARREKDLPLFLK